MKILFFGLCFIYSLSAQFDPDIYTHLLTDIFTHNYTTAEKRIHRLENTEFKYLCKATLIQAQMQDVQSFNPSDLNRFDTLIDSLIQLHSDEDSPHMFLGSYYFLKAAEEKRRGAYFSAYKLGNKGRSVLETHIEKSSDINLKLPVGLLMYWKSVETKWIPFFSDEKEEGLTYIKDVINYGTYSKLSAIQQYIYILSHQKMHTTALQLAEEYISKYPRSRMFKWAYAYALIKAEKHLLALPVLEELFQFYKQFPLSYNTLELNYKMALCKLKLNKVSEAYLILKHINQTGYDEYTLNKIEHKLEHINTLLEELDENQEITN